MNSTPRIQRASPEANREKDREKGHEEASRLTREASKMSRYFVREIVWIFNVFYVVFLY